MSEQYREHRNEKLSEIVLPEIECGCLDKRTRKVLVYLVNQELKRYKTFPTVWVENAKLSLEDLKDRISSCDLELAVAPGTTEKSKKKRSPSKYNLFIGKCASGEEKGGMGKTFKQCAVLWKEEKAKKDS